MATRAKVRKEKVTALWVSDSIRNLAKSKAAMQGTTMRSLVEKAILKY